MNVNYINPFLKATKNILNQLLGSPPEFKKPFINTNPLSTGDLLVIIGVTGEVNGKVIINVDKQSCTNIASQMMGGMPVEFNEISKSAISELCNMILGSTATHFSDEGITVNITSPTVLEGQDIKISQKEQIICVPVDIAADTKILLNISLLGKAA